MQQKNLHHHGLEDTMCTYEKMQFDKNQIHRYDLEKDDAPRKWLFMSIKPIWLLYEPWAEDATIEQTIAKKSWA